MFHKKLALFLTGRHVIGQLTYHQFVMNACATLTVACRWPKTKMWKFCMPGGPKCLERNHLCVVQSLHGIPVISHDTWWQVSNFLATDIWVSLSVQFQSHFPFSHSRTLPHHVKLACHWLLLPSELLSIGVIQWHGAIMKLGQHTLLSDVRQRFSHRVIQALEVWDNFSNRAIPVKSKTLAIHKPQI